MGRPNKKRVATDCTLCYHSCGMNVTVKNGKIVRVEGLKDHPLNKGHLCPKGERAADLVYHPDRLRHPLKRIDGAWKQITWDQALDEISGKLTNLKEEFGPEVLSIFCGSIGVENLEMMEMAQRFKGAFGTPNFVSVEGICYRMRIRARQITFGKYPVEEMDSKLYLLWGHNPEHSDFPLHLAIEENLARGAQLVVIDPRRISLAKKAEMYLPIRPGTDAALALALMHVIINEGLYDSDFVRKWTDGFDRLVTHVQPYTPRWAEKITWIPAGDIERLGRLYATTEGASIHQGINTQDQTASGTQTSRAFAILQSITGNINNQGGWVFSPRLKLTDVGIPTDKIPIGAHQYPMFYEIWGRKSPYGQVVCFPENVPSTIRGLIVTGGNPVVSMPDSKAFREALSQLDLLVVLDLFMTETAELAHYVLPACTHFEKNGLAYSYNVCHGIPYVMLRKKVIEPLHQSWSEFRFWTELGRRLGLNKHFEWETDEELVECEMSPTGLNYRELRDKRPSGAYYMQKKYGMERFRGFPTPSGKIEIYSETLEKAGYDPLPTYIEPHQSPISAPELWREYPLILTTGARNLYFTHSQHRNIKPLRDKAPEPSAEINTQTARRFGIRSGERIVVETPRGQIRVRSLVTEDIAEGVVSVSHGWPGEGNTNILTDVQCREPIMGYPQMKSLLCSVKEDHE